MHQFFDSYIICPTAFLGYDPICDFVAWSLAGGYSGDSGALRNNLVGFESFLDMLGKPLRYGPVSYNIKSKEVF